MATSYQQVMAK